jgi:2-methylcitrate dehydratase
VLPESFSNEKLWDPRIRDLLTKIKVIADPEIDDLFPRVKRARVTIQTKEGEKHTIQTDVAKGSPADPMSDEEIVQKFKANAAGVLSNQQMEKVIEKTWQFENLPGITEYMQLMTMGES